NIPTNVSYQDALIPNVKESPRNIKSAFSCITPGALVRKPFLSVYTSYLVVPQYKAPEKFFVKVYHFPSDVPVYSGASLWISGRPNIKSNDIKQINVKMTEDNDSRSSRPFIAPKRPFSVAAEVICNGYL